MFPVETVIQFSDVFDFVKLGWGVSVVAFLIIFFLCWGISMLVLIFKKVGS